MNKEKVEMVKLQVTIQPKMMEQIQKINEAYCHTGTAETLRYLLTRGLIEDQSKRSIADLAEANTKLAKMYENPDFLNDLLTGNE